LLTELRGVPSNDETSSIVSEIVAKKGITQRLSERRPDKRRCGFSCPGEAKSGLRNLRDNRWYLFGAISDDDRSGWNFLGAIGNEDRGWWHFLGAISNEDRSGRNFFRPIGNEESGWWHFFGTISDQDSHWWDFFRSVGN
jgi:hypothetical protein